MGPEAAPNYERRRLSLRGAVGADSSGEHTQQAAQPSAQQPQRCAADTCK